MLVGLLGLILWVAATPTQALSPVPPDTGKDAIQDTPLDDCGNLPSSPKGPEEPPKGQPGPDNDIDGDGLPDWQSPGYPPSAGGGGKDDCPPDDDDPSEDDEPTDSPPGSSDGGSIIDNTALRFRHHAVDYSTPIPAGCQTCGSVHPGGQDLPALKIIRGHNYDQTINSTLFGKHVGWNWDIWLRLGNQYNNAQVLQSNRTQHRVQMRDTGVGGTQDGTFKCEDWDVFDRLETYNSSGNLTADRLQTVSAKLFRHDGAVLEFEVFSMKHTGGGTRYGRLTSFTDRNGNQILFTWEYDLDDSSLVTGIRDRLYKRDQAIDAYGRTFTFRYATAQVDGFWVCDRIDLPNGEHIEYQYGTVGPNGWNGSNIGLTKVIHPDNAESTFEAIFDTRSQCVRLSIVDPVAKDPLSRTKEVYLTSTAAVDDNGSVVGQAGNRIRMMLNGADEVSYLSWQGSVSGQDANFIYQGGGKLTGLVLGSVDQVLARYVKDTFAASDLGQIPSSWIGWSLIEGNHGYDGNGRWVSGRNGAGNTFSRVLDPNTGRATQVTHYDSTTSTATYNSFKQPLVRTDRLGRVTQNTYDANGNLLTSTRGFGTPEAGTWTHTYNSQGQGATSTDANGNVTENFYSTAGDPNQIDGSGYLVKIVEPADVSGGPRAETLYFYDTAGRVTKSVDPLGREMVYGYDERNRVVLVTYFDGSTEVTTYADPATQPADANLVVSRTDRNSNLTTYAYDGAGRITGKVAAAGTSITLETTYTYLDGTRQLEEVVRDGNTTNYTYDNRARRITKSLVVDGGTTLTTAIAYDNENRIDFVTDPYGRRTFYVYDVNNRLKRKVVETVPGHLVPPAPGSYTDPIAYLNARDNYLMGLTRSADGMAGANALHLIEDLTYDGEGQLVTEVDPRGFTTNYAYDAQGRNTSVVQAVGTSVEARSETVYDPQGNVIEVRTPRYFDSADAGGYQTSWVVRTYTGRNLLATSTEAPGTPVAATESYTYFLDQRLDTTTDARGNDFARLWGVCCARIMAVIDPPSEVDGSGVLKRAAKVMRHDFYGNLTHSGTVSDVDNVAFANSPGNPTVFTDLPDGETLQEITTRYDARHRPVASTSWLVPLAGIDPDDAPIAGGSLPGDPAVEIAGVVQGLTTIFDYDDDLSDGVGLDSTYAAIITAKLPAGFFAANSDGYGVAVTNPEGETTVEFMDGMGRSVLTIDPTGDAVVVDHDNTVLLSGQGLLVQSLATDPLGGNASALTDGAGRLLRSIDEDGQNVDYRYDNNSNLVSFRDANGDGEDCVFDARDRQIECRDTQEIAESTVRLTGYDANSNVVVWTDAKAQTITAVFDARDRQVSNTDRINAVTAYTYDENSNLLTITDAEGGVTTYTYDPRNLQTTTAYPGHNPTSAPGSADFDLVEIAYDGLQRPSLKTDQLADTTTFVYDLASRLTEKQYREAATSPPNLLAHWPLQSDASDTSGNGYNGTLYGPTTLAGSGPGGQYPDEMVFDGVNDYAAFSGLPSLEDDFTISAWVKSTTPQWSGALIFERVGRIQFHTRTSNNNFTFQARTSSGWQPNSYSLNNLAGGPQVWRHYAGTWSTTDNARKLYIDGVERSSNTTSQTVFSSTGSIFLGRYTAINRFHEGSIVGVKVFDRALTGTEIIELSSSTSGNGTAPTDTDTYTYDKASRLLTADSERYGNTVTYTYTDDGLIASENIKGNVSSNPNGYTLQRGYDAIDRLTTITHPNGSVVTHSYTDRHQLDSVTRDPDGLSNPLAAVTLADFNYDPAMRETSRVLGNGLTRTTVYGRADQLRTAMTVETGPGLADRPGLSWSTFAYDANKNLNTATTGGVMNPFSFTTQQDAEDRLTQWDRNNFESQEFTLSSVGDWDGYQGARLENGQLQQFQEGRAHNAVHEIESIDRNGPLIPIAHDAKGNLTLDEDGKTYTWDFDNRLQEVRNSNGDLLGSYTYDAIGRRVTKTVPGNLPGDPTATTAFVNMTLWGWMGQVQAEYEDNTLKRQYSYGEYLDEPLTLTRHDAGLSGGQETLWYHRDRQYNVTGLTDSAGTVVERYAYSPYGERRVLSPDGVTERQVSAYGNHVGHQGLYHDREAGLIYNRMRYRDFNLGRWLQREPLGYFDGMNMYAFVSNQPLDWLDPTGLQKHNTNRGGRRGWKPERWLYTGDGYATDAVYRAAKESAGRNLYRDSAVRGGYAGGQGQICTLPNGSTIDLAGGGTWTMDSGGNGFIGLGGGNAMNNNNNPGIELGSSWSGFGSNNNGNMIGQVSTGVGFGTGGTGINMEMSYDPIKGLQPGGMSIGLGYPLGDKVGVGAGLLIDPTKLKNLYNGDIPLPQDEYCPCE